MVNEFEAGEKSGQKGNSVIYLALAVPLFLAVFAIGSTVTGRYSRSAAEPKPIGAPDHQGSQSNPATLIKPQNVRYVG